jgi:hypothetical protein
MAVISMLREKKLCLHRAQKVFARREFDDALARIKYLEKKLGIESGV